MDRPSKIRLRRRPAADRGVPTSQVRVPIIFKGTIGNQPLLRFDVPPDCSVELSPLGYQFFTEIFETFDKVRLTTVNDYIANSS